MPYCILEIKLATYWKYHHRGNARGKRLLLPSVDELVQFGSLIINRLNSKHINEEWFSPAIKEMETSDFFSMTARCSQSLKILRNTSHNIESSDPDVIDSAVNQLHSSFNLYFSDEGWRQAAKALSQAKKRTKTMRTEIRSSTHALLLKVKEETKQDSIDQTIEFLIDNYRESLDE